MIINNQSGNNYTLEMGVVAWKIKSPRKHMSAVAIRKNIFLKN
jgi:hypothetical protein